MDTGGYIASCITDVNYRIIVCMHYKSGLACLVAEPDQSQMQLQSMAGQQHKFVADTYNLIKNSQAVKKGAAPKKAMVKKDVKSKVAAKKWL